MGASSFAFAEPLVKRTLQLQNGKNITVYVTKHENMKLEKSPQSTSAFGWGTVGNVLGAATCAFIDTPSACH